MIGDKYIVKEDCVVNSMQLKKGDILIEKAAYNYVKGCREDSGMLNEIVHERYGCICEVCSVLSIAAPVFDKEQNMLFSRKTIIYARYCEKSEKWIWGCGKCKRYIAHSIYKFCPFCGRKIIKYVDKSEISFT